MNLKQFFEGQSSNLLQEYERITSQFEHKLSKGESRERALKKLLSDKLPSKYGVGSGFVFSSIVGEKQSNQVDIVIYDKQNCPLFFDKENTQIYPVEMVHAVIEIKSNLDSKELEKAFKNIKSVKCLTRIAFQERALRINGYKDFYGNRVASMPILGLVFAYDGLIVDNLLKQICELDHIEANGNLLPDFFTCLKKSYVIGNIYEDKESKDFSISSFFRQNTKRYQNIAGNDTLIIFYLGLYDILSRIESQYLDIKPYIKGGLGTIGKLGIWEDD